MPWRESLAHHAYEGDGELVVFVHIFKCELTIDVCGGAFGRTLHEHSGSCECFSCLVDNGACHVE